MSSAKVVEIRPIVYERVSIRIQGMTELILHNWSAKAKKEMLDKQMGKARPKKEAKDPTAEYEAAFYRLEDGSPGFPVTGIKAAIAEAARSFEDLTMVELKRAIFVYADGTDAVNGLPLVRILGEPRVREDMVRIGQGVADLRYRPGFPQWEAGFDCEYNTALLSAEQLFNLVNEAGRGGIGEWRPSAPKVKSGWAGTFRVVE